MAKQWTDELPPNWYPDAVATLRGWENPDTGELLVSWGGLASAAGSADIVRAEFVADSFERGADTVGVYVYFNEKVDISAGATLVVTRSTGGTITLTAVEQLDTGKVLFEAGATVDIETILSVGAQTITATVTDDIGAVAASKALTLTANAANDETVVIDGKTYTFKTTLTNTNGFVKLGSTKEESLLNLAAAITLGVNPYTQEGAGTIYAAATTLHSTVTATALNDTLTVTAKVAGTAGNSLAISETLGSGAWAGGATTLSGGAAAATSSKTISAPVGSAAGTALVTLPAAIQSVAFANDPYTQNTGLITVVVTYDFAVDVTAGATMTVMLDTTEIELTAAEQLNDTTITFTGDVPDDTGTLTIPVQEIAGSLVNDVTGTVADKAITDALNNDTATIA